MTLVTLREVLQPALKNGYAVAGLVTLGWEDMRAYVSAAEAEDGRETVLEQLAVGQARQVVVHGVVQHPLLRSALLGDVGERADDAYHLAVGAEDKGRVPALVNGHLATAAEDLIVHVVVRLLAVQPAEAIPGVQAHPVLLK